MKSVRRGEGAEMASWMFFLEAPAEAKEYHEPLHVRRDGPAKKSLAAGRGTGRWLQAWGLAGSYSHG